MLHHSRNIIWSRINWRIFWYHISSNWLRLMKLGPELQYSLLMFTECSSTCLMTLFVLVRNQNKEKLMPIVVFNRKKLCSFQGRDPFSPALPADKLCMWRSSIFLVMTCLCVCVCLIQLTDDHCTKCFSKIFNPRGVPTWWGGQT